MKDEIKKRLSDIHTAILDIESFLGEKRDFIEYTKNKMLKSAVERKLEIIGEATNYILKVKPDIEIAGARRIVDMRNRVIHAYDSVDDQIIWGIVVNHIPKTKTQVERMLADDSNNE